VNRTAGIVLILIVALASTACTAPGEPPSHPSKGDYHDVIRRETDKTTSTLATIQLVVGDLRKQRITKNYAVVMSRQVDADLTAVLADLRQITAPTPQLRRTQRSYQHNLDASIATVAAIPRDWNHEPQLHRIATRLLVVTARAKQLANQLN
jgi:hypothetical protein